MLGSTMSERNPNYDVLIIGGGWSGLLACKYCLAAGLSALVLESRDRPGGVWAYTDDQSSAGVMKNTKTTSSRCITEISDFPMPVDYPDFPSHSQINSYLGSYCVHHQLSRHIALNKTVENVMKVGDGWRVTTADGAEWIAAHIVIASGVHRAPNDLSDDERFRNYSGTLAHSASFKEIPDSFSGRTVLIWGGGETASDIAFEASDIASNVYFCIPNGQWFVPKLVDRWPPFPSSRRKVADHTSSRLRLRLSPTHQYSPFIYQYIEYAFGFNGHGQEPWRTEAPYHRSFFNKSSEVLGRIKTGEVIPKRDISHCNGKTVHFTDGTSAAIDHVIMCSGYTASFPFFGKSIDVGTDPRRWFKYIFYDTDPSIAFVGFVRPIVGSIPGIAELQSRYVAEVFSGKCSLPDPSERAATINADTNFWNHHFRFTSMRLAGLVDHFIYCNQLAKLIGCYPDFKALFLSNPRLWWQAIIAPWNGCQFWLNDLAHRDRIVATYLRYDENRISQNYIFLVLAPLLPLIGFYTHIRVIVAERISRKAPRAVPQILIDTALGENSRQLGVHRSFNLPAPPLGAVGRNPWHAPSNKTSPETADLHGNVSTCESEPTVALERVILGVVEMLSGERSREHAFAIIHPLVTIHMGAVTYCGLELWQKWVYLLRNCGHLRELRFLPSKLSLDSHDACVVNLVGVWTGIGRSDGLARQAIGSSHFRYRLERGRIVELWTERSNYDFILGRWVKLDVFYLLFLCLTKLRFWYMSWKGLNYRVDRAG
jgi:dimethylaniline monooxygenase (N-oxide forming)